MKNNIQKSCTKKLIFAIFLTICLVAGIPLIVVGASKAKLLMVLGIVMTVAGFYGSPLVWISFAKLCTEKAVYFAIVEDNILSAKEIANNLGRNEKEIIELINHLISNRFLTGYKLDETGKLTKTKKPKDEQTQKEIKSKKCPNCGANLTKTKDNKYFCKYCGVEFDK